MSSTNDLYRRVGAKLALLTEQLERPLHTTGLLRGNRPWIIVRRLQELGLLPADFDTEDGLDAMAAVAETLFCGNWIPCDGNRAPEWLRVLGVVDVLIDRMAIFQQRPVNGGMTRVVKAVNVQQLEQIYMEICESVDHDLAVALSA